MSGILTDGSLGYFGPGADFRRSLRGIRDLRAELRRALEQGRFGDARIIHDELERVERSKLALIAQHLGLGRIGGGHDN